MKLIFTTFFLLLAVLSFGEASQAETCDPLHDDASCEGRENTAKKKILKKVQKKPSFPLEGIDEREKERMVEAAKKDKIERGVSTNPPVSPPVLYLSEEEKIKYELDTQYINLDALCRAFITSIPKTGTTIMFPRILKAGIHMKNRIADLTVKMHTTVSDTTEINLRLAYATSLVQAMEKVTEKFPMTHEDTENATPESMRATLDAVTDMFHVLYQESEDEQDRKAIMTWLEKCRDVES
eukprot:g6085.t1